MGGTHISGPLGGLVACSPRKLDSDLILGGGGNSS